MCLPLDRSCLLAEEGTSYLEPGHLASKFSLSQGDLRPSPFVSVFPPVKWSISPELL